MKPIARTSILITTVMFIIAGTFGFIRKFRR